PRDYPACEGIMRLVYGDQLPPTTAVRVDEYGNRAFIVEVELTVAMPGQVGAEHITESAVPTLGPGYPIGVRAEPFLFLSGLHPLRADGSLVDEGDGGVSRLAERQAEQIYANLGTILGEQGAGLDATVRQVIYVADRGLIPVVERVAAAAFGESPPATTFVPLPGLWPSPTLVQVDATATI
ncbi:MAG: RidA family protein, partial [Chloroflexi bacterium]|nr:RidA family protein [Chloroflexota bacterium]